MPFSEVEGKLSKKRREVQRERDFCADCSFVSTYSQDAGDGGMLAVLLRPGERTYRTDALLVAVRDVGQRGGGRDRKT